MLLDRTKIGVVYIDAFKYKDRNLFKTSLKEFIIEDLKKLGFLNIKFKKASGRIMPTQYLISGEYKDNDFIYNISHSYINYVIENIKNDKIYLKRAGIIWYNYYTENFILPLQ